jgi:hypothetical protein
LGKSKKSYRAVEAVGRKNLSSSLRGIALTTRTDINDFNLKQVAALETGPSASLLPVTLASFTWKNNRKKESDIDCKRACLIALLSLIVAGLLSDYKARSTIKRAFLKRAFCVTRLLFL